MDYYPYGSEKRMSEIYGETDDSIDMWYFR
jgi:hypothetical protein